MKNANTSDHAEFDDKMRIPQSLIARGDAAA